MTASLKSNDDGKNRKTIRKTKKHASNKGMKQKSTQ